MSYKCRSFLAAYLESYIDLRRKLGCQFRQQANTLHEFDRYLCERESEAKLTQDLALDFATYRPELSSKHCANRYNFVRNFSRYLAAFEPETPPLSPKVLCPQNTQPPAHIYTESELALLLQSSIKLTPQHPMRGLTFRTIIGLAASTGLRNVEVVNLDKADVDLESGVLLVRGTKFHKERIVPVHPTTLVELTSYARLRDVSFPEPQTPAFFLNMRGCRIQTHTIQCTFWRLTQIAGLRDESGKGPRFHDLRHTFAVKRMARWYREGVDVQGLLPLLATYMGHVHYSNTAYYITAVPELMELAAQRYQTAQNTSGDVEASK
ncbi:MAG: tyrosine-type recombinase/integrase [Armatimonadota bacterium]